MPDRAAASPATPIGAAPTSPPRRPATAQGRSTLRGPDPFMAAFDESPIGALICAPDGDRSNAALRKVWHAGPDARLDRRTIDRSVWSVDAGRAAADGDNGTGPRPVRAGLAGRTVSNERFFVRRLDGSVGVARLSVRPLELDSGRPGDRRAGRSGGAILVAIDETAAYDAERLRDAFLGIVGHELRSPISSIVGAAELLASTDLDPSIRIDVTAGLNEEAHRLHRLIEQLIRLADLDRRGVQGSVEPVHLGHVARRVVERRRRRTPNADVTLRLSRPDLPP